MPRQHPPPATEQTKRPSRLFANLICDEQIQAKNIQMPREGGGLTDAEPLVIALSRVRRGEEHLVQLSEPEDGVAICKISTIQELQERQRQRERQDKEQRKSSKQSLPKQIELNWAIASHDLSHKMNQLKTFINDGRKVEIVLATKRRQRRATIEEGTQLLEKIRQTLANVEGKEIKPMTGGRVGQLTLLTVRKKELDG